MDIEGQNAATARHKFFSQSKAQARCGTGDEHSPVALNLHSCTLSTLLAAIAAGSSPS